MAAVPVDALVQEGWDALADGDPSTARAKLEQALADDRLPRALEGLAQADYLDADYAAAAAGYERAYTAYRTSDDIAGAARCARMLAWISGNIHGDWAMGEAWEGRACTVLEQAPEDSPEHGWLCLLRAVSAADRDEIGRALEIARQAGDVDLETEALGWLGLTAVFAGRADEGLTMIGEALAAIVAGEVDDIFVVEGSLCGVLWGCEVAQDVDRAQQWMRVAERVRDQRSLPGMAAFCRIHNGAILTAAGRWTEAGAELDAVVRAPVGDGTRMRIMALARLAELRVRQGRLEEAARLLDGFDRHPDAVHAMAALHLAAGDHALGNDIVVRAIDGPVDACGDVRLLALAVEVSVATGDLDRARAAAARLGELAERGGRFEAAIAALAQGIVCVACGDEAARTCLDRALTGFAQLQTPLELARARLVLARAVAGDRSDLAIAEAKTALAAFEELGASRDADAAGALLRELGAPVRTGAKGTGGLTKREREVLELVGEGLSNPEIGDRLFITRKTVEHHVANVLSKLGLRNRAEAAAYAAREPGGR